MVKKRKWLTSGREKSNLVLENENLKLKLRIEKMKNKRLLKEEVSNGEIDYDEVVRTFKPTTDDDSAIEFFNDIGGLDVDKYPNITDLTSKYINYLYDDVDIAYNRYELTDNRYASEVVISKNGEIIQTISKIFNIKSPKDSGYGKADQNNQIYVSDIIDIIESL